MDNNDLARLVVTLVEAAGGQVRLNKERLAKANTGDTVYIEDVGGDEIILTLRHDELLAEEAATAVHGLREMIYDLEVTGEH